MNILIVEDNKDILDFLKTSLTEEGFVVDTMEDGELGLERAKSGAHDLIILDNVLPKKNGQEICAELRKCGFNIPIIMLSVNADIDTKVELLNCGADDYVAKPFSFSELLARVRALLRRPEIIKSQILKIGDLAVDTINHTVKKGNKEIALTRKEFSLLEYFTRNQGKVLSRAEILEHVWDMNADPFTNTIETHIFNLRKKLGRNNGKELIHTISGIGYKIEDF